MKVPCAHPWALACDASLHVKARLLNPTFQLALHLKAAAQKPFHTLDSDPAAVRKAGRSLIKGAAFAVSQAHEGQMQVNQSQPLQPCSAQQGMFGDSSEP